MLDVSYTNDLNFIVDHCRIATEKCNQIHDGSADLGALFQGKEKSDNVANLFIALAPSKHDNKMKNLKELVVLFDQISAKMGELRAEDRIVFEATLNTNDVLNYMKISEIFEKANTFLSPKPEKFDDFSDRAMTSDFRLQIQRVQNEAQNELNRLNPEEQRGRCTCIVQ